MPAMKPLFIGGGQGLGYGGGGWLAELWVLRGQPYSFGSMGLAPINVLINGNWGYIPDLQICLYVPGSINSHYFHIIGDGKLNPIVEVYIPIIRIPIKGGKTIPNTATFDHGTYAFLGSVIPTLDLYLPLASKGDGRNYKLT